jgi:hypothetical protein
VPLVAEVETTAARASLPLMVATLWATGYFLRETLACPAEHGDDGDDHHISSGGSSTTRARGIKQMRKCLTQALESDLPAAVRRAAAVGLATSLAAQADSDADSKLREFATSTAGTQAPLPAVLLPFASRESENTSIDAEMQAV